MRQSLEQVDFGPDRREPVQKRLRGDPYIGIGAERGGDLLGGCNRGPYSARPSPPMSGMR